MCGGCPGSRRALPRRAAPGNDRELMFVSQRPLDADKRELGDTGRQERPVGGLSTSVRGNRARMMYRDQYERCIPTRARSPVAVRQLMCSSGVRSGSLASTAFCVPCGGGLPLMWISRGESATQPYICARLAARLWVNQPSPVRKVWGLAVWASRMTPNPSS